MQLDETVGPAQPICPITCKERRRTDLEVDRLAPLEGRARITTSDEPLRG